jgi:hypothetical protein
MKDPLFKKIPEEQQFSELTEETLGQCMEQIEAEDPKYNNCIILDDVTASLKDYAVEKMLKMLVYNRRHMRTSIFFLSQSYVSVPLSIRKLFNNMFIFKVNKKELNTIFDECLERHKDRYIEISNLVFDKPHQYIFLNTDTQRIFKGFDELIFS